MNLIRHNISEGSISRFILNIEEASFSMTLCIFFSLFFLTLVGVDKKIKFHKVIVVEHMLRLKKFSSSETHFKMSLCLPIAAIGFLVAIFKTIYTEIYPEKHSVSIETVKVNTCTKP